MIKFKRGSPTLQIHNRLHCSVKRRTTTVIYFSAKYGTKQSETKIVAIIADKSVITHDAGKPRDLKSLKIIRDSRVYDR